MTLDSRSTLLRRFLSAACLGIALAGAFSVSEARADYTFNLGNLLVDDDPDVGSILLSSTLPAGNYTSYVVSTLWSEAFDAYSDEALWDFTSASPATASTIFYGVSGISSNAVFSPNPITLTWSGNLLQPYSTGPLYFNPYQNYPDSSANWNNTVITLKTAPIVYTPPASSTSFTMPTTPAGVYSTSGSLAAGQVVWKDFVYTGGGFSINTFGSALPDAGFGPNDTEIGLYDALGTLIGTNDDAAAGIRTSELKFGNNALTVGSRYYIAVGAYLTNYGAGFGATSVSTTVGTYQLNVVLIPEAGTGALLGIGSLLGAGIALGVRRRKAA